MVWRGAFCVDLAEVGRASVAGKVVECGFLQLRGRILFCIPGVTEFVRVLRKFLWTVDG